MDNAKLIPLRIANTIKKYYFDFEPQNILDFGNLDIPDKFIAAIFFSTDKGKYPKTIQAIGFNEDGHYYNLGSYDYFQIHGYCRIDCLGIGVFRIYGVEKPTKVSWNLDFTLVPNSMSFKHRKIEQAKVGTE